MKTLSVKHIRSFKLILVLSVIALCNILPNFVEAANQTTTFYNVYIPPGVALDELGHHLNVIKTQLQYKERSKFPEGPLYFVAIGKDVQELPNCINCERIDHKITGNEISTLTKLQEYCKENPDKNVAYMHNQPSFDNHEMNELLRRMLTKSVFSDECLLLKNPTTRINNEKCTCNVCSARFSPIPHYHTSGNMWVADCQYVSKLVSPESLTAKMDHIVYNAPADRIGRPSTILGPFVGRGRYASGHWVYSHPDVCPCDVYPGPFTWNHDVVPLHDEWEPELVHAPRFPNILDYEKEYEKFITSDDSNRRDWVSLAGRIYEWQGLYDAIPPEKSWVWKYYGEGADYFLSFFKG